MTYTSYRGGLTRPGRYQQRGSGFFSTIGRFLIPLARKALPHVVGAVGDLFGGKNVKETLKTRGRSAGAAIAHEAADMMDPEPPRKGIKRKRSKGPAIKNPKRKRKNWR